MRKREEEGTPLVNIERHPLVLIVSLGITGLLAWYNVSLFSVMHPLGFVIMTPTVILAVQSLWLILTPFAMVYADRVEFRQSFFHQKRRYFIDLKRTAINRDGKFYIVYHDDEVERLHLFGIRPSHVQLLKTELDRSVTSAPEK